MKICPQKEDNHTPTGLGMDIPSFWPQENNFASLLRMNCWLPTVSLTMQFLNRNFVGQGLLWMSDPLVALQWIPWKKK